MMRDTPPPPRPPRSTPARTPRPAPRPVPRPQPRRALAVLCGLLGIAALFPAAAHGQLRNLDDATFIAGLEQRGMSDLILHFLEVDPPDDPVVRELIAVAQNRLRFRDEALPRSERNEAFERAVDGLQRLIDRHADHPQSAIWLTDLAAIRLIEDMRSNHRLAATFVRFGVPTPEQYDAFERLSTASLEHMRRAQRQLFKLRGELVRNDDRRAELEADGTYSRLFREYAQLRVPFYHGLASLYVASLPDDASYFRNLGRDGRADTPAAERRRLVTEAMDAVEPLADTAKQPPAIARGAYAMLGQLYMVLDRNREAIDPLDEARSIQAGGTIDRVISGLALAKAYAATGRMADGMSMIDELSGEELVASSPYYRLLLADAAHRLLREEAEAIEQPEQREAAVAEAYGPYLDLLEDASLNEQTRRTLRSHIYQRWASLIDAAEDAVTLPPIVRMGIGEHLLTEARRALAGEEADRAQSLLKQANTVNESLRDESLPSRVRARGMYHLALGHYFLDRRDRGNIAKVAGIMTEVAADHPDRPIAEQAIANAVSLSRSMASGSNTTESGRAAYLQAIEVLLKKYPTTKTADAERVPYAVNILQAGNQHGRAIEVLEGVPRDHASYFEAQAWKLRSRVAMFRAQEVGSEQREELRSTARSEATRIAEAAQDNLGGAEGQAALRAWAEARFTLAAVSLDEGQTQAAIDQLEGFEQDFRNNAALVRRGYEEMISAQVEANELEVAVELAERMTDRFAGDSAYVINQVVTRLDQDIESLRRRADEEAAPSRQQALRSQAQSKADAASRLTGLLLAWAEGQDMAPEELLAYQVLHGETLRLAGKLDESLAVLEPLVDRFPTDGEVLFQYGQTQFALARQRSGEQRTAALSEALRAFGVLSQPGSYRPPFPEMYWVSNLRVLQVMDMRGDDSTDILLRIRRLQQTSDEMGGPALKRRFEAIRARHS